LYTGGGTTTGGGAFLGTKSAAEAPWLATTAIAVAASRLNEKRRIIADLLQRFAGTACVLARPKTVVKILGF
jgi:hypothetical protein